MSCGRSAERTRLDEQLHEIGAQTSQLLLPPHHSAVGKPSALWGLTPAKLEKFHQYSEREHALRATFDGHVSDPGELD